MELSHRVPFLPKGSGVDSRNTNGDNPLLKHNTVNRQSKLQWSLLSIIVVIFSTLLLISIYYFFFRSFSFGNMSLDIDMLEVKKCPGCAGQSICPYFYRGEIRFTSSQSNIFQSTKDGLSFPVVGYKATMGLYETTRHVLLRRLGSPATPYAVDEAVCRRGLRQGSHLFSQSLLANLSCIPHLSIWRWLPTNADNHDPFSNSVESPLGREVLAVPIPSVNQKSVENKSVVKSSFAPATRCSSDRLFEHLQKRFLERTSFGAETRWLRFDELMFLFNLAIDPQSIIIQSFPRKENWPFPTYLGSCGRWSVEEYHGVPLSYFCLAPLWIRLQILLNILSLPEKLEHPSADELNHDSFIHDMHKHSSSHGYTIYLGDFDLNSLFLVDPITYDVTVSNLRHAIIVDTQTLINFHFKSTTENKEHTVSTNALNKVLNGLQLHNCFGNLSTSGDTNGNIPPCLHTNHVDNLCSYQTSDHNIWVICTSLLYGVNSKDNNGCNNFLYQIPNELYTLIKRCVHESGIGVRRQLIEKARHFIKQNI